MWDGGVCIYGILGVLYNYTSSYRLLTSWGYFSREVLKKNPLTPISKHENLLINLTFQLHFTPSNCPWLNWLKRFCSLNMHKNQGATLLQNDSCANYHVESGNLTHSGGATLSSGCSQEHLTWKKKKKSIYINYFFLFVYP